METLGERLQKERKRLKLNQTDFAAACDQSKASQIRYEDGERSPDGNYLAKAAELGVDIAYVITGQPGKIVLVQMKETAPDGYSPAEKLAQFIASLKLSMDDAEVLKALAERLANPAKADK